MDEQRIRRVVLAALVASAATASLAWGEDAQSDNDAESRRLMAIVHAEHPQTGDVAIPAASVTLHLGRRYYFLGADEAKRVLKEWGNPPDAAEGVLGMVFPAGSTPFDQDEWGGVITYEPVGYISDRDANKTDYQKYVEEAHAGEDADNAERKKAGFGAVHLVGWAQPPSYDKTNHTMIWARDLQFADHRDGDTLNYAVRVLGRRGYLSINVVTAMSELARIRPEAAGLAAATSFHPGSAYADFQPDADKQAAYGVAGLVAAGVGVAAAQKLGVLAAVALFAKKFIAVIVAAGAALAARAKRLFKKGPDAPA